MGKEITSITMRRELREAILADAISIIPSEVQSYSKPSVELPQPVAWRNGIAVQIWNVLQYPLFAGIGIILIFNSVLGQMEIATVGVVGLVFKLPSKLAFAGALFLLVTVPLFIGLKRPDIADTIAVYVFELLVVATVLAIVELRREGGP